MEKTKRMVGLVNAEPSGLVVVFPKDSLRKQGMRSLEII